MSRSVALRRKESETRDSLSPDLLPKIVTHQGNVDVIALEEGAVFEARALKHQARDTHIMIAGPSGLLLVHHFQYTFQVVKNIVVKLWYMSTLPVDHRNREYLSPNVKGAQ
jgi:hypothetical protein